MELVCGAEGALWLDCVISPPTPVSPCVPMLFGLLLVGVSVVVTIRQRAESLSVRVGADHFLVSHHPGGGIIHLGREEQTVKDTDTTSEQRKVELTKSQG